MGSRRRGGAILAALVLAALSPGAPAHAAIPVTDATPIAIGAGYNASVTVDAAGTAHIAFDGNEPTTNTLHYCRLPRGATSCAVHSTIPAAAATTSLEHPFVVPSGDTIRVVSYRYGFSTGSFGQDVVYTSTDGGVTWDGGLTVGQNPFHLAILGPGNAVSTITQLDSADGGTIYQRLPLDGSSAGNTRANLSTSHLGNSAVGLLDADTPIAVMDDLSDNAFWRRFSGSGDPNDAANWTPEQPVGVARQPHFAFGPNGVFLIGGENGELRSRRFNGNGFDGPVTIPGGGGEVPQAFATQDPSGRIHVTFPQITAQCCKLLYATSDDGTTWAARQFQLRTDLPGQTQVSVAADHLGVAVWHTGNGSSQQVWALPVGPSAAVPTTGRFAGAAVVSGTVLVKVPGSNRFVALQGGDVIPVGSIVDATGGEVRITIALRGGRLQSTDFSKGTFRVTQAKSGLGTMVLAGGGFKACGRAAGRAARIAKKAKVVRQLWGSGRGRFRTKGRYAAASIRGTDWQTIDRCDGTLVRVTKGRILVTDLKTKRRRVLGAGQSYLARARR